MFGICPLLAQNCFIHKCTATVQYILIFMKIHVLDTMYYTSTTEREKEMG